MAQYAVLHSAKSKGSGGSLGNHIDRVEGKEHTYKNADAEKRHLNREFCQEKYKELSLPQAIDKRIEEGYNGKRKIRSDAVKSVNNIFSGSHERMTEIFKDEKLTTEWLKENYKFACNEFGKDNIVRFSLHMDEKTPHIHCVTVPLTKDGRLSAKEIMGNKKDLEKLQDRYAERMKPFGLERGISTKLTGAKHETAKEWNKKVANNIENKPFEEIKSFLGVNRSKTIEKAKNELKTLQYGNAEQKTQLQRMKKENASIEKKYDRALMQNSELRKANKHYSNRALKAENLVKKYENKVSDMLHYDSVIQDMRTKNNIIPKQKKQSGSEILQKFLEKSKGTKHEVSSIKDISSKAINAVLGVKLNDKQTNEIVQIINSVGKGKGMSR